MALLLKTLVVLLLVALSVFVQCAVWACVFGIAGSPTWSPLQLMVFALDSMYPLVLWRLLRRKPSFPAVASFVLATDVVFFVLALLAR